MHYQFFGVDKAPFSLTADPKFLYLTPQHRDALAGLAYAILARRGLVVLTGAAGTGKTTLLARVIEHLPVSRIQSSVILNSTLSPAEFLEAVLMDFGIEDIPASKAQRLGKLHTFLWTRHQRGQLSALIVDEAQKLSVDVLEEIRLLGNFESTKEKLLQVALVGQCELDDVLNSERLWQLRQRIAQRMMIGSLSAAEVGRYIQHRWRLAGGNEAPFSAEAVACIGRVTGGIPRLINAICENALIEACGEESAMVETRHILGVCRDLQLSVPMALVSATVPQKIALPAAPGAVETNGIKTLERYSDAAAPKRSLLGRLLYRFTSPRTEPA
jgi:general secretion pathway protein A